MSTRPTVPQHVIDRQREASDPTSSAWVSANAGSGKTHVLTQRVIRLLLSGVDPSKILCLTFTKAAAANMATRVFDTLAKWTSLDDDALAKDIAAMEGRRPDARRLLRARRLFAAAPEPPGGLKVQTIHAFCTALLHQFPFEADVAARFDVMDDRATAELIDRLRLDVLQEAADRPDTPLGKALAQAIVSAADVTFADVVREAVADGDALRAWVDGAEGLEPALRQLSFALGAGPDDTPESIGELVFGEAHLPPGLWPSLIAALDETGGNATYQSARLRRALMESGQTRLDSYLEIFFSEDATLKLMTPRKNVVAKKFRDEYPDLGARIDAEQERLVPLYDRLRAVRLRDRTAALVRIAHEVLARYAREKDRAGLLDYDDLIDRTLKLLARGGSEWVMYKLDLGIDHVLIDEAQDTSPKQWEVVEHLTAEFTAGAGARAGTVRSIFAVGDEKQSIYSFQGAVPLRFGEMRSHFETRHRQSDLAFARVDFLYSFRSSPDVLGAVDEVFAQPNAYSGLSADNVRTVHEAVRSTAPGSVELWPLVEPEDRREVLAWDRPFDATSEHHPRARLAQRIAATIREWIARGEPVVATGKPMQPGDVLILVRQRGQLFEAIIRALKDAGVDVAGADRLVLTEHIAVMDLMSLAEALLLPDNDLALAEALKSPLFGFDDDQLFALAHGRGSSLRRALARKAADDPRFAETAARLDELATAAQRETPFAFFARLLGPQGGRRRFLARLGPEAADALDEFLALALEYGRQHVASLQGFIGWLRSTPPEIK
ncbi:MAG: double-strand break repair helicase AddA, partial [Rhizobiales bacterium]|nr:double-strand break repair helicase AddA [Hyphomicrobiales bacterium]